MLEESSLASEQELENMIVQIYEHFTSGKDPTDDFETKYGQTLDEDDLNQGSYHREFSDNEETSKYFVPIQWLETKRSDEAIQKLGMFGNQNTMCKPTTQKWRSTVDRLKLRFPKFHGEQN